MISREEAFKLIKENLTKPNLIKHVLAFEAIMRGLAKYFGDDEKLWGLVGLLHDIDYEKTENDTNKHALLQEEILKEKVSDEIIRAIKSHGYWYTSVEPKTKMENALVAADSVSGLIIACALILPTKKLKDVKVENLLKRFKEKDFARNCRREEMIFCEKIGLSKEKFFEISLDSLKKISDELGL